MPAQTRSARRNIASRARASRAVPCSRPLLPRHSSARGTSLWTSFTILASSRSRISGAAVRIAVVGSAELVRRVPMTALFAYRRRRPMLDLAWATVLLAAVVSAPARAADPITVVLDQATIAKLPEHVSTIVIGNPLIADVTVQAGGLLVVTGKGYGTTNL